jgi:hypothetical protein
MRPARLASSVLAVVLTGCAGRPPTAAPITTPAVTAAPATLSAVPSVAASVGPPACPADPAQIEVALSVRGGGSFGVSLGADPLPTPEIVDRSIVPIEETVVGGVDLTAELRVEEDMQLEIAITSVTADFLPYGTATTTSITSAFEGSTATLRLPDVAIEGQFRVEVAWTTRCGDGRGAGTIGLAVVPASAAAGCPVTSDEVDAAFEQINAFRITIGGIDEPLDVYGWSTRWTPGNGVTDFGQLFPNWDRDVVITVAPEAFVAVREKVDELQLVSVRASIYQRADVDDYFVTDELPDPVTVVRRSVNPNGNVNIPAPLEPGSYVFDIDATWLTPCFELQTTRTMSVEVH